MAYHGVTTSYTHVVLSSRTQNFLLVQLLSIGPMIYMSWCAYYALFQGQCAAAGDVMQVRCCDVHVILCACASLDMRRCHTSCHVAFPASVRLSKLFYIGVHRTDECTLLLHATVLLRVSSPLALNFTKMLKVAVCGEDSSAAVRERRTCPAAVHVYSYRVMAYHVMSCHVST